jgi:formate hydrogenlyase subunit 6/NADH:ubiquinone oxidoreductase subunit I/flavodoxin
VTTEVYYFSGTGNCLAVARAVGARLGREPRSIADFTDEASVATDADTIGLVFPAYLSALHGVPLIVERFLSKVEGRQSKRLFAICTCGGYELFNAAPALRTLAAVARRGGWRLTAEYAVRLPMNNLDYEHIPVPIETDPGTILGRAEAQVDDICDRIATGRNGRHRAVGRFVTLLMSPAYRAMAESTVQTLKGLAGEPADSDLGFRELMVRTDHSIRVDSRCTGCGICVRVCPAGDIELVEGRPVWLGRCEMCCACDEWCPSDAIHHWQRPDGAKYHHPSVTSKDLFVDRGSGAASQARTAGAPDTDARLGREPSRG